MKDRENERGSRKDDTWGGTLLATRVYIVVPVHVPPSCPWFRFSTERSCCPFKHIAQTSDWAVYVWKVTKVILSMSKID
jgi:hypothetical protein